MIRLLIFFILSVMATGGTSMAENVSTCSVDTVPIQMMYAGKHFDVTRFSETQIVDFPPGFSAFVTAITEHVAARLDQEKLYLNSTESKELSLLQFVSWPVSGITSPVLVPPLEAGPSGACRILSPWIDITIVRKPVPYVRAVVRYSERQLLADQAVLAGEHDVPPGMAIPLGEKEFKRYADLEYAPSEIQHRLAIMPIEARVPPDLLWLFRRAWQDSSSTFSGLAGSSMRKAMKTGAEGYTKIVIALIDQCFACDEAEIQYNSILDVADLVSFEQYKIVTPIISKPIDF